MAGSLARACKDVHRGFTYAQYEERSVRLANALLGLGLGRGDRVAILSRNRVEWMELYAACAKSGTVAVPLNLRLAAPEIRRIVEDCEPRVLFVEAALSRPPTSRSRGR